MHPGTQAGDRRSTFEVTQRVISRWLIRLWWTSASIDALVLVASVAVPADEFPLRRAAPLIAASALVNAETAARLGGGRPRIRWMAGTSLLLHVALLTALLELSGGPSNPFSVIYAVQIALAALTLGSRWASLTALAATDGPKPVSLQSLARVEWEHIQRVLADCHGNLSQAARLLGIHRRSLQRKLSKDPVPESRRT